MTLSTGLTLLPPWKFVTLAKTVSSIRCIVTWIKVIIAPNPAGTINLDILLSDTQEELGFNINKKEYTIGTINAFEMEEISNPHFISLHALYGSDQAQLEHLTLESGMEKIYCFY